MQSDTDFQESLIAYLEDLCNSSFMNGNLAMVKDAVKEQASEPTFKDPVRSLPTAPPKCSHGDAPCSCEQKNVSWLKLFHQEVDTILYKSNRHSCSRGGCKKNKYRTCKAHFSCDVRDITEGSPTDGDIELKHQEEMMNTFCYITTFLFCCNTDVTSLLSGTAIRAVLAYVTDYVSKFPLKMYGMLESVNTVFDRHVDLINGSEERGEKARRLVTAIVNSMTTKMEIGSPMASAYLLGQPDHYTSHRFRTFYWQHYVAEIGQQLNETEVSKDFLEGAEAESLDDEDAKLSSKVMIMSVEGKLTSYKAVLDYTMRPDVLNGTCLYELICRSDKFKVPGKRGTEDDSSDDECDINPSMYNDSTTSKFSFLPDHPQFKTHNLLWLQDDYSYVPNIVGGMLPRRDKGDQDY